MASAFHCRSQCLGLTFALRLPIEEALVFAISAGGVEVADAIAFFQCAPVVWLGRGREVEVHGRRVILVDDGLSSAEHLLHALWTLREAGAEHLRLVTPWLGAADRALLGPRADEIVCERKRAPRKAPYEDPACDVRAEQVIERSLHRAERSATPTLAQVLL